MGGADHGPPNSSLLWTSRTPPSGSRYDHVANFHNRQNRHNGVATLNRNFGSPFGNRLAISNLRNTFEYPSTASTSTSAPFQRFGGASGTSTKIIPLDTTRSNGSRPIYAFGNRNTGYNTVHAHHPVHNQNSMMGASTLGPDSGDTGEDYEDLDYYERPPVESPQPTNGEFLSGDSCKTSVRQNAINSFPQCNISSTTTTTSGGCVANDTTTGSDHETNSPIPSFLPSTAMSTSAFSVQKNSSRPGSALVTKTKIFASSGEKHNKKPHRTCFGIRRKKICIIVFLLLLTTALLVLGSLSIVYIFYLQRKENSNLSLSDFLRDSSLLFQQKQRYSDLWGRVVGQNMINGSSIIRPGTRKGSNDSDSLEQIHDLSLWTSPFGDYGTTALFGDDFGSEGLPEHSRFNAKDSGQKSDFGLLPATESEHIRSFPLDDIIIEPSHLLTLQITRRKICLFEVSTSEQEQSRREFRSAHIPGARLLFYSSLSHNGVPVHPLQFQRYARSLGIDDDCRVILYDRGQQMWSAYAYWIFQLYDHTKVSLLNGGFEEWRKLSSDKSPQQFKSSDNDAVYRIESGVRSFSDKTGNFRTGWNSNVISTFDDVLATFEAPDGGGTNVNAEIIDAQTTEEFDGKTHGGDVIFGHIRGAINIPTERLYDPSNGTWSTPSQMMHFFREEKALVDIKRPLIVYDGTSLRAAMVWLALRRQGYAKASIYFGSWPEWVIRAPDYLKIIPDAI